MKLDTAVAGVLQERGALQQPQGISSPSYISEHMQLLTQYNSALEENLAEIESNLEVKESDTFKAHRKSGLSVNAAQVQTKYDIATDRAEVVRLKRLCSSSWSFISSSQSRVKHLIEEAHNQI